MKHFYLHDHKNGNAITIAFITSGELREDASSSVTVLVRVLSFIGSSSISYEFSQSYNASQMNASHVLDAEPNPYLFLPDRNEAYYESGYYIVNINITNFNGTFEFENIVQGSDTCYVSLINDDYFYWILMMPASNIEGNYTIISDTYQLSNAVGQKNNMWGVFDYNGGWSLDMVFMAPHFVQMSSYSSPGQNTYAIGIVTLQDSTVKGFGCTMIGGRDSACFSDVNVTHTISGATYPGQTKIYASGDNYDMEIFSEVTHYFPCTNFGFCEMVNQQHTIIYYKFQTFRFPIDYVKGYGLQNFFHPPPLPTSTSTTYTGPTSTSSSTSTSTSESTNSSTSTPYTLMI